MIKILQKNRRRMLKENKSSRYLLYAIGEIVLVVIGILIALQVNNWNIERKDRAFEVKMLTEISSALEADKDHLSDMIETFEALDSSAEYFMRISIDNVQFHDSLYSKLFGLNMGIIFQYNSGPYEALKSSGLDRISNDSLRSDIINYFEYKIPMLEENVAHITRNHQFNIEQLLLLLGERSVEESGTNIWVAWKKVPAGIFQQQEFLEILSNVTWRARAVRRQITALIPDIQSISDRVNREIKQ